jgi:hypothetical protein
VRSASARGSARTRATASRVAGGASRPAARRRAATARRRASPPRSARRSPRQPRQPAGGGVVMRDLRATSETRAGRPGVGTETRRRCGRSAPPLEPLRSPRAAQDTTHGSSPVGGGGPARRSRGQLAGRVGVRAVPSTTSSSTTPAEGSAPSATRRSMRRLWSIIGCGRPAVSRSSPKSIIT